MRNCHPCHECCIQYVVPEINKPFNTPCPYICETGCAIHDQERCNTCTEFVCEWLRDSKIPDYIRPDLSKMIIKADFALRQDKKKRVADIITQKPRPGDHLVYVISLIDSYAHHRKDNKKWLDLQMKKGNIVILICDRVNLLKVMVSEKIPVHPQAVMDMYRQIHAHQIAENYNVNKENL